jgi:hypothetical protein
MVPFFSKRPLSESRRWQQPHRSDLRLRLSSAGLSDLRFRSRNILWPRQPRGATGELPYEYRQGRWWDGGLQVGSEGAARLAV